MLNTISMLKDVVEKMLGYALLTQPTELSPENINYLIIFLFSLVAIAMDIGLSFM